MLSACDSGLWGVRQGDELMGLASALFALGTATLIASVVPVPDEAVRPVMVRFHADLRAGRRPAEALAMATQRAADPVAAAAFVCFGAG